MYPSKCCCSHQAVTSSWCLLQEYVDLLIEEINASVAVGLSPLKTIYFGGGTPSLIPLQQLERLIRALDRRFGVTAGAEVSMEADPGTFDAERLRQYMSLGLTRFSVGVQAFQEVSSPPTVQLSSVCNIYQPPHPVATSCYNSQSVICTYLSVSLALH